MSSAKWWRAEGGYQDVPAKREEAAVVVSPPPQASMCFCQTYERPYAFPFGPTFTPWLMPQGGYVQGPIPVAGLSSPPPPYITAGEPAATCAPPQVCAPPEAEKKEDKEDKKCEEKKVEKRVNPWAPPKLPVGANYLFDGDHTMVHIFKKAAPIWTEKYRTQQL